MSKDESSPTTMSGQEPHLNLSVHPLLPPASIVTDPVPPRSLASSSAGQGRDVTLDAALEIVMLRHKMRALESITQHHGLPSQIPILSEAEEARALQYRCQCHEAALVRHGLDMTTILTQSQGGQPPQGYSQWLETHINAGASSRASQSVDGASPGYPSRSLFKCCYHECYHYVYGFATRFELDAHLQRHAQSPNKSPDHFTDMASFRTPMESPRNNSSNMFATRGRLPPGQPPRRLITTNLSSLPFPTPATAHKDSASSLNFPESRDGLVRKNTEADIDAQLPPLKRARTGHRRLQSIGELNLPRDKEPCLRCRITSRKCDTSEPCFSCASLPASENQIDWTHLGCFRGPIASLVDLLLLGPLSSPHTQTPISPPNPQQGSVNELIVRSYPSLAVQVGNQFPRLDFDDNFWRMEGDFDWAHQSHVMGPSRPDGVFPPALQVIISSNNYHDTAYDLLGLLTMSGQLSSSREMERITLPALFRAKQLLREVVYYDVLQPRPALQPKAYYPSKPVREDTIAPERNHLLREIMMQFLAAYGQLVAEKTIVNLKSWLGAFISLCILSAVHTILIDITLLQASNPDASGYARGAFSPDGAEASIRSVYKTLVGLFSTSSEAVFDDLTPEEGAWLQQTNQLIRRETWPDSGISSSFEFLMRLGDGDTNGHGFNGFLRQARHFRGIESNALPPIFEGPQPGQHQPGQHHQSFPSYDSSTGSWQTMEPTREGSKPSGRHGSEQLTPSREATERLRRHTVGAGEDMSAFQEPRRPSGEPIPQIQFRPVSLRSALRRVYCEKCNDHPDGFRGEHELRRHVDAKHSALVRRWVCKDPHNTATSNVQPMIPLSRCKACLGQKRYGAYYNAAAHLRRAHFRPHRAGKASGDWPSMNVLKDWMREVRQPVGNGEDDSSSGAEDGDELRIVPEFPGISTLHSYPKDEPLPWPVTALMPQSPTSASEPPVPIDRISPSRRPLENRTRCPHPECGRVFRDLAAHMLTHQEQRPEKCPIVSCEYHVKGFARKYDKNRHALTHYRGAMACPFCPGAGSAFEKTFNRADVFKRHLTASHHVDQAGPGGSRRLSAAEDPAGIRARCSICECNFPTALDFYEHLDECVLGAIVPSESSVEPQVASSSQGHDPQQLPPPPRPSSSQ